jgi:hypothetical protein
MAGAVTATGGAAVAAALAAGAAPLAMAIAVPALWLVGRRCSPPPTRELPAAFAVIWGLALATLAADPSTVLLHLADPVAIGSGTLAALVLVTLGIVVVTTVIDVPRRDGGVRLLAASALIAWAMTATVDVTSETLVFAATVLGIAAVASLAPRVSVIAPVAAISGLLVSLLDANGPAPGTWDLTILAAMITATLGTASLQHHRCIHAAGIGGIVTMQLELAASGASPDRTLAVTAITAITLTGLCVLRQRPSVLDTLAGGSALALIGTVETASAPLGSMAVAVVGGQAVALGAARRLAPLVVAGTVVSALATVSLWWTTGTNARVLGMIEPFGADGSDVVIGLVSAILLAIGIGLRRRFGVDELTAYGAGLGLASSWLLASQLDGRATWATFGGVAFGTVAIAVGGLRHLRSATADGVVTTAGTLLVSAGDRLADAPTWTWIAVGGTGLLVLAAFVERRERTDEDPSDPQPTGVDDLCDRGGRS